MNTVGQADGAVKLACCRKCSVELTANENWSPSNARSHIRICRACTAASSRAWRLSNPERVRENGRAWRQANPERHRENCRAWRATHPERMRENDRRKREADPERYREIVRRHRAKDAASRVYIAVGEKRPGELKVGQTTVNPAHRLKALNIQYPGGPFRFIHTVEVSDPRKAERYAHALLAPARTVGEFFAVDLATAKAALDEAAETFSVHLRAS